MKSPTAPVIENPTKTKKETRNTTNLFMMSKAFYNLQKA